MTKVDETNISEVRQSVTGSKLSDSQSDESKSLAEIMHRGIRKNGKFREKLTDYSHAFARGEKFDALRAEMIIRDRFKVQYGETMNQMWLGLKERQENLPETAGRDALEYARMIEPLIRDGDTMPFYRAYDYVGGALSENPRVIAAYEKRLSKLETDKLVLAEKQQNGVKSAHSFDDLFELATSFLANPWKLWESGQLTLKRTVLKLAFSERIAYCRNEGL